MPDDVERAVASARPPPVRVPLNPMAQQFQRAVQAEINKVARVAAINIPLTPGGERLRQRITAQIEEIEQQLRIEIPVDVEQATAFRRRLAEQVRDVGRTLRTEINIDVNRGSMSRVLGWFRSLIGLGAQAGKSFGALADAGSRMGGVLSRVFGGGAEQASQFGAAVSSAAARGGQSLGIVAAQVAAQTASVVANLSAYAAGFGLLAGAALAAGGAVTAAVTGLPVVLATVAAPIAAIAIGFEGIQRAAETLRPEVDQLRKSLSLLLEFEFRGIFEALRPIFPVLERGLLAVATATSAFARRLVDVTVSADGLKNVEVAIQGSGRALDRAAPAAARLFAELLAIAGTFDLYTIFGDTIGGISDRFADFLRNMRESGLLTRSLEQLRDVLFGVSDALFALAEGATEFFTSAGPGLTQFFDGLERMFRNIDFASLGEDFGRIFGALGDGLARIPPETWDRLAATVDKFANSVRSLVDSGALETLVIAFTGLIGSATLLLDGLTLLIGPINEVLGAFGLFGGSTEEARDSLDQLNTKTTETSGFLDGLTDKVIETSEGFSTQLSDMATTAGEHLTDINDNLNTTFSNLPERMDEWLSSLPERAGYWLGSTATRIALEAKGAADSADAEFSRLRERLPQLASETASEVSRFFSELPGRLQDAGQRSDEAIYAAFTSLRDRVSGLAGEARDRVVQFIHEIPDKLKDLGALMDQVATDMWEGFINGVKRAAGRVVQAARDVVSGAIQGARDELEEGSPSKVFQRMGVNAGTGFELGLLSTRPQVVDAITTLFGDVGSLLPSGIAERVNAAMAEAVRAATAGGATFGDSIVAAGVRRGVGTGAPGADAAGIAAALATALPGLRLAFVGPSVVEIVDDEHRKAGRR